MADALVQQSSRAGPVRFFCHHCNLEFEDTLQEYICPYCSGGFIEELAECGNAAPSEMETDSSDNIDEDTDGHPFVDDLAFLMSGGRLRDMLGGAENLLQQIVWALTSGTAVRAGQPVGMPFVLVGAPGDYVLGGEGLDAVVTQLLGQLEGTGPPPLPADQLTNIERVSVSQEQVDARLQCSVCWDHFTLGEQVSRLACTHVFHAGCIEPWLNLHATCPICRHCLLPDETEDQAARTPAEYLVPRSGRATSRAVSRRLSPPSTSTSSTSSWEPSASSDSTSEPSRRSSQYNMELDFD